MTKGNFCARIDEAVLKQFKEFVLGKYGKIYGSLGVELQQAIVHWMHEQGLNTHTNTRINPGMPRVQNKIDGIIGFLKDLGFTNQFSYSDWERACINVVGSDKRTIDKYLRLAARIGRVKFYAGRTWEIV